MWVGRGGGKEEEGEKMDSGREKGDRGTVMRTMEGKLLFSKSCFKLGSTMKYFKRHPACVA